MKTEDRLAGEAADRLLRPDSPVFFDELWKRVERDTRARALRRRRLGMAVVAVAAAVVAAAGVYAAPAIFPSARAGSSVVDGTYSCRVQLGGPALDLDAVVTLPASPSRNLPARRAFLNVTTVVKKLNDRFFATIGFQAARNTVRIDRSVCRASGRPVPLKPAGLAAGQTITPDFIGSTFNRCVTTPRVLVHLRLALSNGVPTRALLAIHDDNAKSKPVAFVKWSRTKITPYLASGCVSRN